MYCHNFKEGELLKTFFVCIDKIPKYTKYGDLYLDVLLRDKDGSIRGKVWANVDYYSKKFNVGDPVALKGIVTKYKNTNEINISSISLIENNLYEDYGYNPNLLLPEISESVNKLYKSISEKILILDNPYKKMLTKIYKIHESRIKSAPSKSPLYNLKGGYIKQVKNVLDINKRIGSMKKFDNNMLTSLIIIKNIGYIDYYKNDFFFSLSNRGKVFDVNHLSFNILLDCINGYEKFPLGVTDFFQSTLLSGKQYQTYIDYIKHLDSIDELLNSTEK